MLLFKKKLTAEKKRKEVSQSLFAAPLYASFSAVIIGSIE
jgi:hypothetical protein